MESYAIAGKVRIMKKADFGPEPARNISKTWKMLTLQVLIIGSPSLTQSSFFLERYSKKKCSTLQGNRNRGRYRAFLVRFLLVYSRYLMGTKLYRTVGALPWSWTTHAWFTQIWFNTFNANKATCIIHTDMMQHIHDSHRYDTTHS